jgi:hypothetical protein
MEPRLTEFSYGYCVTEELANNLGPGLKSAPYFPSLYVEGKVGGGFDVQIGKAVFLQFKLCEELVRRTARETQEGLLEPKFFRFWLHRRDLSHQHRMLVDLEAQPGNQVYYIAPAFADVEDLDQAYKSSRVVERSAMFSPADIGELKDDKQHRVSFRPGDSWGWFLSEPRRIRIHRGSEIFDRALSESVSTDRHMLEDWLGSLNNRMVQIIRKYDLRGVQFADDRAVETLGPQRNPLERAAYLARTYFGCELFLVVQPSPAP